jgi:hypothetical protein
VNPYTSVCDDHGLYLYLNSEMPLPNNRETVLHFFEALKKRYPTMTNFYSRQNGEFVLEEEKETGTYRWSALEARRLCSGYVNPPRLEDADAQHLAVLEMAPYHFDINSLDCEALDVVFAFDLNFNGNHDEVVAEALAQSSALEQLLGIRGSKVLKFEPMMTLALDQEFGLQCRLSIETRSSPFQVKSGQFGDDPISVYFTVRQYWHGQAVDLFAESYQRQREIAQELVDQHVLPAIVQPLAQLIASK